MHDFPPPLVPAIDTALTKWERHGRPGLPENGFALARPPGRRRQGIYRADTGSPVIEPEGHILRMAPSPDGRSICVQLAERADEDAALGLVDTATGSLRLYPRIRCRYDPMLWEDDSSGVELVAGRSHSLVRLDARTGRSTASAVPPDTRLRLFPGGRRGLLAESRPGSPSRLIDRATGAELAEFAAIVRVLPAGEDVVVDDGARLQGLDPGSGARRWRWDDPDLRVTSFAARGQDIVAVGVRAGRGVIVRLVRGSVAAEREVTHRGAPAVATGVSADADRFHVLIEGPALPPRVVPAEELLSDRPAAARPEAPTRTERYAFTAEDGSRVPVVVTSPTGAKGPAPLILTCYGGFGVPSLPVFEPTVPAWAEHGGRYAIAQVRGGGEHGSAWRQAGRGLAKGRGIEDLAVAARGLVGAGLTRPDLLVLAGASHGGVLATSCALGSPDLCAGVVSTAAPLDLLNLGAHPLGRRWADEFGASDTPRGIEHLRRISPLHRARELTPGTAPPRFLGIVLAEDSRVVADDTLAVVDALRRVGGSAAVWRAPETGHGGNHLDSLHRLGTTVLGFAATITGSARTAPSTT
ncbi:dipeptidyl aminopeptidase/acylaminoacyl peptidase [Nocardiopsis arvandica]|uniref:prolyl oligopeptidase n=1 Tax=Nocardiopsis sinuspersici TaxID=501010 RepID=A0A7Y9XFH9_9ACTN|nr:prolyl oligopeptidase family serine peptidase [Nocardiopsis sinuspersici]NYH54831.1 dipeptidyl aminopeptidase/acylaminoacyl peptidase [Nocardiopsis sinuspersici]